MAKSGQKMARKGGQMARKDELLRQLHECSGGSPSELAELLNVDPSDRTFRRALEGLAETPLWKVEGQGPNRTYTNLQRQQDPVVQAQTFVRRGDQKPPSWLNTRGGHDFLMRRAEAFGVASSRYFKRREKVAPPDKP